MQKVAACRSFAGSVVVRIRLHSLAYGFLCQENDTTLPLQRFLAE